MKAIKVNADYESVLFTHRPLPAVNEALEFLAFFVQDRRVYTKNKYSDEYLRHVEAITGRIPKLTGDGEYENWWGELGNLELARELNSKEKSAGLVISKKWCERTKILATINDLPPLEGDYIAKTLHGFSGQSICQVSKERLEGLEALLRKGKVIIEPFFKRGRDFSHYVFQDGKTICYENLVDQRFQYRGTIFQDHFNPSLENLSLYNDVKDWREFTQAFKEIVSSYRSKLDSGFSIDSFTYVEDGQTKIRFLSEVNYRKTMGLVAYELAKRFAGENPWTLFTLFKGPSDFSQLREKLAEVPGLILLSPGNTRYDFVFLSAKNSSEGKSAWEKMRSLLPDRELAVEL